MTLFRRCLERKATQYYSLAICLLFLLVGCGKTDKTPSEQEYFPVTIEQPRVQQIDQWVTANGVLIVQNEIKLNSPLVGQPIQEIRVQEGDRVTAGETLMVLDDRVIKAQLELARQKVKSASAAVHEQAARVEDLRGRYARLSQLVAGKSISKQELDSSKNNLQAAQNAYQSQLGVLEQARANLSEAEVNLERTLIKSPVTGTVITRNVDIGMIPNTEPVLTLLQDGTIEVNAEVSEADMALIRLGQEALTTWPGHDDGVAGKVRLIMPSINQQTRLGEVRLTIPMDVPAQLGIFTSSRILVDQRQALTVNEKAVVRDADTGDSFVYCVDAENKAQRMIVKTGQLDAGRIEIKQGIDRTCRVVARGGVFLADGQKVRIISQIPIGMP